MAEGMTRGQIWLLDRPRPDKRRPVLILSRPSLIRALHTVTVVAITSTSRGAPTEVQLGPEEGLKGPSCANLCNLFTIAQSDLAVFVGSLTSAKMRDVCRALAIATDCD
jgi:mRNA interferase MazF